MMGLLDQFFEDGSHSYLVRADKDTIFALVQGDKRAKEYIFSNFLYERLTIDDARNIKIEASMREATESKRIIYIGATDIGHEAEQSLLKLLEEPPENTKILIATQKTQILPTILSRVIFLGSVTQDLSAKPKLLSLTTPDRLLYIQKLTKESVDTQASRKEILQELRTLIAYFRARAKNGDKETLRKLRDINDVSIAVEARGAPTKMLLEHLAVTL